MNENESDNSVYSCGLLPTLTVGTFTAFHLESQKTERLPQVIKSSPQCSLENEKSRVCYHSPKYAFHTRLLTCSENPKPKLYCVTAKEQQQKKIKVMLMS